MRNIIKSETLFFFFPRFYNFDARMIFKLVNININIVNINLRLARYHSRHLFRNFLLAKFLDWELCSQKIR